VRIINSHIEVINDLIDAIDNYLEKAWKIF
jgi:hypothetical protein